MFSSQNEPHNDTGYNTLVGIHRDSIPKENGWLPKKNILFPIFASPMSRHTQFNKRKEFAGLGLTMKIFDPIIRRMDDAASRLFRGLTRPRLFKLLIGQI